MFVVDTDVVSELRKVRSGRANKGVSAWVHGVPSSRLFVSAITIHELEIGVRLIERRDATQGAVLRAWLDHSVLDAFAHRILDVDVPVARRAAALHIPDPAPFRDGLIAGTAFVHGMAVVTHNVRDFERFEHLSVLDPWQ